MKNLRGWILAIGFTMLPWPAQAQGASVFSPNGRAMRAPLNEQSATPGQVLYVGTNATYFADLSVPASTNSGNWIAGGATNAALPGIATVNSLVSTNPIGVASGGTGAGTLTGLVKGNGTGPMTAASPGTDYAPATSGTGLLKGNGAGGTSTASPGTDYYNPGGTDVAVADGGTGASTANGALDNLATAEASVASATTTDLGAVTSQHVSITGTAPITSFGTVAAGVKRFGRFAGALTLTHNASSLILPGGANITTAANDRFLAVSLGSGNWLVYFYQKADGTAIVGGGGGGSPGGADTQVQYNSSGSFAGSSALTYANATPLLSLIQAPAANTAPTGGIEVKDTTAASSGNQQYSPAIFWEGQGWKTTATAGSQSVRFRSDVVPVQGSTAPTGNWTLDSSVNGGAFGSAMTYSTAGALGVPGNVTASGSLISSTGSIIASSGGVLSISSRSRIASSADGAFEFTNSGATASSTVKHGDAPILNKTGNYTIVATDSGTKFGNLGAAGTVVLTLPTSAVGMRILFFVYAAQTLQVSASGAETIRDGATVSAGGGNISASAKGCALELFCPVAGEWFVQSKNGTWTTT